MKTAIANANQMKMFVHTINTWLVAHLLHPIVFVLYFLFFDDPEYNWYAGIFFITVFSFFASIPSLFIAWFLQYVIANSNFSLSEKYIAWMITVVVAIVFNFLGLEIMFGIGIREEIFEILPPSIIAAILAVLVRHKQFFVLQANYNSIKNENEVV